MPKHLKKRSPSPDALHVFGSLLKKIDRRLEKVERKQRRRRRKSPSPYPSDSECSQSPFSPSRVREGLSRLSSPGPSGVNEEVADTELLNCSAGIENFTHNGNETIQELREDESEDVLPPAILTLLGEDDILEKGFSDSIHPDLASRWTRLLKLGLSEDIKTNLIKKYLPPKNCPDLLPPKINPEVKVAVQDGTFRRDIRLSQLQSQLSAAISGVGCVVTNLIKEGSGEHISYIEVLNDVGRLLSDIYHTESISRRDLIALNLNKDLRDTLKNTCITEWLFGSELDSSIKAAKDLEKSANQLKVPKKRTFSGPSLPSKQGNAKRPLLQKKGVQQLRQSYRTPYTQTRAPAYTPLKRQERYKHFQSKQGQRDR
ncbi:uncharacterized protein LOC116171583 isoform X2 [Photinus pyralis]|uniref:uncharacterized protein LOC116171583 isoform X2 n=1 Tax=Photinus pyralis TaxID=7054 RepID=UPI0012673F2D|nr:uncharacterized protein LOC116171583 isoform X2 [Photinus pyralis]